MVEIAYGRKVDTAFKNKVIDITLALGCDPSFLMACMACETGERFRANVVNRQSGAIGLIQFMPETAEALGTSTAKLATMTEVDQLDYVRKYFRPYRGKMHSLSDVYMAMLWPKAVGKPESFVMFRRPSREYEENAKLDANRDGVVAKGETTSKVQAKLTRGLSESFRG